MGCVALPVIAKTSCFILYVCIILFSDYMLQVILYYTIYSYSIQYITYIYIHNSQHRHKLLSSHYLGTCGDGGVFPNVGRDAHSP